MSFSFSNLHPGEIARLRRLQRPDSVGVVGFKVPEGCGTEVHSGGPDSVAMRRWYGTIQYAVVESGRLVPVVERLALERCGLGSGVRKRKR